MYILTNVVERIKERAKAKNKSISKVLEESSLSKNTLVSMSTRGSWVQANSLGAIADSLECSVDYLLCRTQNPDSHNTHVGDIVLNSRDDQQLIALCKIYDQLDVVAKAKLVSYADELKNKIK